MFKNILLSIFLIVFISSCGYSPINISQGNNSFYVSDIVYNGDAELNKLIDRKLTRLSNKDNPKIISVVVDSKYSKNSLIKNSAGNTTQFLLQVQFKFEITHKEKINNFLIIEEFVLKNLSDEYEERKYEKTIKNNLTSLVLEKLILQISRLE